MATEKHAPTSSKPSFARRLWTIIDIVGVRLRFIFLMVIVGLIAAKWDTIMNYYDRWTRPAPVAAAVGPHAGETEYFCGMHPHIVRSEPGNCPICGMPLTKRVKTDRRAALPADVLAQVHLTPQKVAMGRIATSAVEYRLLTREVRAVGEVDYDQTRRAFITARIKGRLDKLLVNFVGQKVKKGDPLAEIYSPDLLVAQEELLSAVRALQNQKPDSMGAVAARAVVDATRKKLALWGVSDAQIDALIQQGAPQTHLAILSPIAGIVTEQKVLEGKYVMEGDDLYTIADLGSVWMQARIFESEIQGIREGAAVEVSTTAYPNDTFAGRITFIAYTVDPATRTVAVRVEIANPEYRLKPGMFVSAAIRLPVGQVTVLDAAGQAALQTSAAPKLPEGVNTHPLTHAYLAVADLFAADQTDPAAVKTLIDAAVTFAGQATNLPLAAQVAQHAQNMENKSLEQQREVFKSVSDGLIKLLEIVPPEGMKLYIANCPMVKADWLTAKHEILNPYAGSDMLTCGSITGQLQPVAGQGEQGGTLDSDRFAAGYYCPVKPDQLYEKSEHCPIDQFPLKFARIEKVLAVPASAVIDTGMRKIVYRETSPSSGVFDMIQLTLSPRAGEFFPVLAGLKKGDQVATQGAFLVDAENRLNPAAGAQYFGAASPAHQH